MDKLERRVISNNIVPVELIPATATTDVHTDKIVKDVYYGPYIQNYLFWATDGTLTLTPYYEYLEEE